MTTNTTDPVSGAGAPDTAASTAGTTVDWQAQAEEYRKRFTGLQTKYQQERLKWDSDATKVTELSDQLKALTGEREALALETKAAKDKYTATLTELGDVRSKSDRLSLIASKYPGLLPYEVDGLLPPGSGDDLVAKLDKFQAKVTTSSTQALDSLRQGATPPPPAPGSVSARTKDGVMKEALDALREGRVNDYYTLITEHDKLSKEVLK